MNDLKLDFTEAVERYSNEHPDLTKEQLMQLIHILKKEPILSDQCNDYSSILKKMESMNYRIAVPAGITKSIKQELSKLQTELDSIHRQERAKETEFKESK